MPKTIEKRRCRFSQEWLSKRWVKGQRYGYIVGESRNGQCWWVVLDGTKPTTKYCYNKAFIEEVVGEPLSSKRIAIKQRDAQALARRLMYAKTGQTIGIKVQDGSTLSFKVYPNHDRD